MNAKDWWVAGLRSKRTNLWGLSWVPAPRWDLAIGRQNVSAYIEAFMGFSPIQHPAGLSNTFLSHPWKWFPGWGWMGVDGGGWGGGIRASDCLSCSDLHQEWEGSQLYISFCQWQHHGLPHSEASWEILLLCGSILKGMLFWTLYLYFLKLFWVCDYCFVRN